MILFSSFSFARELQVLVVGADNKPVEDIVVYIDPVDFVFAQQKSAQIEISQKDKAFAPYISVIQKNQPVLFNNHDEITHHIFSATKKHSFAFKIRSGATNQENNFTQVGNIAMGCNIHDWMSGDLLVVDTPYFAKTDQQGRVHFKLNETGEMKLKVNIWHPQLNENESNRFQLIELKKDKLNLSFKLTQSLSEIPTQETGEDFDFLDSY